MTRANSCCHTHSLYAGHNLDCMPYEVVSPGFPLRRPMTTRHVKVVGLQSGSLNNTRGTALGQAAKMSPASYSPIMPN